MYRTMKIVLTEINPVVSLKKAKPLQLSQQNRVLSKNLWLFQVSYKLLMHVRNSGHGYNISVFPWIVNTNYVSSIRKPIVQRKQVKSEPVQLFSGDKETKSHQRNTQIFSNHFLFLKDVWPFQVPYNRHTNVKYREKSFALNGTLVKIVRTRPRTLYRQTCRHTLRY